MVVIRYSHASIPLKPNNILDSSGWDLRIRYSDMPAGLLVSSSRATVVS